MFLLHYFINLAHSKKWTVCIVVETSQRMGLRKVKNPPMDSASLSAKDSSVLCRPQGNDIKNMKLFTSCIGTIGEMQRARDQAVSCIYSKAPHELVANLWENVTYI